jgi:hypothetical protein
MPAFADPESMAPPIDEAQTVSASDAGSDSAYLWSEVPDGQHVTITRAVFDRGGYQLYDDVGETIIVPFTDNNLYVMKFAVSDTDGMYFVNEGGVPVLYVPRHGYLENATVAGARWYPFTDSFHPYDPVYLGCAPSWNLFIGMGWYPGMYCRGGYWGDVAFVDGGVFGPCLGFDIFIGGNNFHSWSPYHDWYFNHPAPYHMSWSNRGRYAWAESHTGRGWGGGGGHWASGGSHFGGGASRPISPSFSRWNSAHAGGEYGGGRMSANTSFSSHSRSFGGDGHSFSGGSSSHFSGGSFSHGGGHSFGGGSSHGGGGHFSGGHGGGSGGGGDHHH